MSTFDDIQILMHYFKRKKLFGNKHMLNMLCPLHEEKTPSFMINIHDETYRCFSCDESGHVSGLRRRLSENEEKYIPIIKDENSDITI